MNTLDGKTYTMPGVIRFTVPDVPCAQPRQRHRVIQANGRTFAHNYTPAKHKVNDFKAACKMAASAAYSGEPMGGAVMVSLIFVMPRPGRLIWKKRPMPREQHTAKPDIENLAKSVLDALSELVWRDDSQVSGLFLTKLYAAGNEQPHVEVEVTSL